MITDRIISGGRIFIVRREFGTRDTLGAWVVRERRAIRREPNGTVRYTESGDYQLTAASTQVFRSRGNAQRQAYHLNSLLAAKQDRDAQQRELL
jgi:hypothetical protein